MWAPILLVALRFLQGLGLGGEWGGAVLMTLESGDDRRRGLNASWPQVGVPIGLLLANGVLSLMGALTSDAAFLSWGWRVPFLLSGLLVLVGLWIRMTIAESPLFQEVEAKDDQGPRADRRGAAPLPASRCCWRSAPGSASTSPSTRSSCSSRRTSPPTSSCRAATPSTRC